MKTRVIYTGTRQPPETVGIDVFHVPALQTRCLNPDLSVLPTEPCFAVFYSQNSVDCALELGVFDKLLLDGVVAVGEATAASLRSVVGVPVYTPSAYTFEGVLELLDAPRFKSGMPICSFEIEDGPRTLVGKIDRVVSVKLYATGVVDVGGFEAGIQAVEADWIVFASPRAVELWATASPHIKSQRIASIGSTTTQALRDVGVEPDLEPDVPDLEALLALIPKASKR